MECVGDIEKVPHENDLWTSKKQLILSFFSDFKIENWCKFDGVKQHLHRLIHTFKAFKVLKFARCNHG